jgi:RecB family exonuclease
MINEIPFEFSQSSLQDFDDCPMRFYLRCIKRLAWPAVKAEPVVEHEKNMRRGQRFHRMVHQYLAGIPSDLIYKMAEADEDENILPMWQNFTTNIPPQLNGQRQVEVYVSAPFEGYRLAAVYDLILTRPDGKIIIFDWKTSLRRPNPTSLRRRLQTRVYPYLMTIAGREFNHGCPPEPEQIDMIYWFAGPEQGAETIRYHNPQYQDDGSFLAAMVCEIDRLLNQNAPPEDLFGRSDDDKKCRYCQYRSLCERGEAAGDFSDALDDDFSETDRVDLDFSFDQIGEIGF